MPRDVKMYDIFLSSPTDVAAERKFIVNLASEWNSIHSKSRAAFINILTWEDIVTPALRDRPQTSINEQMGDSYDAYLGIMWSRFGSSTGVSESGTVEEFERALNRISSGDSVHVAMFFKSADIPTAILDGQQFDNVRKFKERYSREGGLYREFSDLENLRPLINRLFENIISGSAFERPSLLNSAVADEVEPSDDTYGEIGLIEWNEKLAEIADLQTEFLTGWSDLMVKNTNVTSEASDRLQDMAKIGGVDPSVVNEIMKYISGSLDELTAYIERNVEDYISRDGDIIELVNIGFDLFKDFSDDNQKRDWVKSIKTLLAVARSSKDASQSLLDTILGIPRLSQIFNKSRNRFARAQNKLIEEFDMFSGSLESVIIEAEALSA